jgi:hypothetical protein
VWAGAASEGRCGEAAGLLTAACASVVGEAGAGDSACEMGVVWKGWAYPVA